MAGALLSDLSKQLASGSGAKGVQPLDLASETKIRDDLRGDVAESAEGWGGRAEVLFKGSNSCFAPSAAPFGTAAIFYAL